MDKNKDHVYDEMDQSSKHSFDWNKIVTKSVKTSDGKDLGKVDGLEDLYFIVKDGIIDPLYYRVPREKLGKYDNDKVILSLTLDEVKSPLYQKDNPGYYRMDHDPDSSLIVDPTNKDNDNVTGRTSNTIS
jgi:sporulation protein YlmC with PRC-barrel domain